MGTETAICLVRRGNGSDFHLPFFFLLVLGKKTTSPWSLVGNGGGSSPGSAPRRAPQARAQVCGHQASSPEVGPWQDLLGGLDTVAGTSTAGAIAAGGLAMGAALAGLGWHPSGAQAQRLWRVLLREPRMLAWRPMLGSPWRRSWPGAYSGARRHGGRRRGGRGRSGADHAGRLGLEDF